MQCNLIGLPTFQWVEQKWNRLFIRLFFHSVAKKNWSGNETIFVVVWIENFFYGWIFFSNISWMSLSQPVPVTKLPPVQNSTPVNQPALVSRLVVPQRNSQHPVSPHVLPWKSAQKGENKSNSSWYCCFMHKSVRKGKESNRVVHSTDHVLCLTAEE